MNEICLFTSVKKNTNIVISTDNSVLIRGIIGLNTSDFDVTIRK